MKVLHIFLYIMKFPRNFNGIIIDTANSEWCENVNGSTKTNRPLH